MPAKGTRLRAKTIHPLVLLSSSQRPASVGSVGMESLTMMVVAIIRTA